MMRRSQPEGRSAARMTSSRVRRKMSSTETEEEEADVEDADDNVEYWRSVKQMATLELQRALAKTESVHNSPTDSGRRKARQRPAEELRNGAGPHTRKQQDSTRAAHTRDRRHNVDADHNDSIDEPGDSTFWHVVSCVTGVDCVLVVVLCVVTLVTLPDVEESYIGSNLTHMTIGDVAHEVDILLRPFASNLSNVLSCDAIGISSDVLTCPTGLRGVETALIVASIVLVLGGLMLYYRCATRPRARNLDVRPEWDDEL